MKESTAQAEPGSRPWNETEDRFIVDWKRIRSQIEHEDQLINNRMTWLLQSQALLFTGFALTLSTISKEEPNSDFMILGKWLFTILPLVGLSICLTVGRVVDAALCQIKNIHDWWEARAKQDEEKHHPPIIGSEGISSHRRYLALYIPSCLAVVWLGVLVAFYQKFLLTIKPAVSAPALCAILMVGTFLGGWYARSQKAKSEMLGNNRIKP